MRDVDRQALPTIEQGKAVHQERKIAGLEADRATVKIQIEWEEALDRAAVEKEKTERRFVEPRLTAQRSPFLPPAPAGPPHPQLNRTAPEYWLEDVAREVLQPKPAPDPPKHLKDAAVNIWTAWHSSPTAEAFVAALNEHNIQLAAASKEEADRSYRLNAFAREVGNLAPVYAEGEILAVTERGHVYRLNERTTGEKAPAVEKFLAKLDRTDLLGIEPTKQLMQERADLHEIERQAFRDLSGVGVLKDGITTIQLGQEVSHLLHVTRSAAVQTMQTIQGAAAIAGMAGEAVANIASEAIEMLGDMIGATQMTPERVQAAIDAREVTAEQREIDMVRFREDADYRRRCEAREREESEHERQRRYYEKQQERERER